MDSFLTHVFRKWLLRAILCHHLPNSSFFATFRYTYISELRNASANPILQAAKVTPEPTWKKNFNPYLPEMALMRILCHHLSKWSFFGTFLNTQISELRYTNANRIWSAYRITLEPTWEKKLLTHIFRRRPLCAILSHNLSKGSFFGTFWTLRSKNSERPAQIRIYKQGDWLFNLFRK